MARAFTVPAEPATVWPWLVQLGKHRAGWYLPRGRRAIRVLDPRGATLAGKDARFAAEPNCVDMKVIWLHGHSDPHLSC